jgi:hypothetical protein
MGVLIFIVELATHCPDWQLKSTEGRDSISQSNTGGATGRYN